MKLKFFFLLLLTLTIIHQTSSIATIRYVSKTGSSTPPYTSWLSSADSIQKCINICVDGDTIYVANGIYKENLIINTAISLIGSSMDSTVIDGRGMGNVTISLNNDFFIENIKIYGKQNGGGDAAIRNLQQINLLKINYCKISEASIGIGLVNTSIEANSLIFTNLTRGISLLSAVNLFHYNISNCAIFVQNQNSSGIYIGFAENAIVSLLNNIILCSEIYNPGSGISLGASKSVYISNNVISGFWDNIFMDTVYDTAFIQNNVLLYQDASTDVPASIWSSGNRVIVNNVVLSKNRVGILYWFSRKWNLALNK